MAKDGKKEAKKETKMALISPKEGVAYKCTNVAAGALPRGAVGPSILTRRWAVFATKLPILGHSGITVMILAFRRGVLEQPFPTGLSPNISPARSSPAGSIPALDLPWLTPRGRILRY